MASFSVMTNVKWLCLAGAAIIPALPLFSASCSAALGSGTDAGDAGEETSSDVGVQNDDLGPLPDGNMTSCKLGDGTDPVALCVQKIALNSLHTRAFNAKTGVATSWSPTTEKDDLGDGGLTAHVWTDDVGYAAACALYHTSATVYGDTQLTPILDTDLTALVPLVKHDLSPLPDDYSGEPYAHLRLAAGGLRTINDVPDGDAVDALANAYGRASYSHYFFALSATSLPVDGGRDASLDATADASVDGARPVDGSADATVGSPDATVEGGLVADASADVAVDGGKLGDATSDVVDGSPLDAGAPLDGIFGRAVSGGGYAYLTASAATAAYAMLDLASRNPTDPSQAAWQRAAVLVFAHLHQRARDPATGLYFSALVAGTTAASGTDTVDTTVPGSSVLLTDTTATVALAMTRARDLLAANPSGLAEAQAYPFGTPIADALSSLNGTPSLYDGPVTDAGSTPTGFLSGYATGQGLLSSKETRANAFLLAVLTRQFYAVGPMWGTEIAPLTLALTSATTPNTSLFSVISGQNAFFAGASRGFGPLAADAGSNPDSYESAAVVAFVDAFSLLLPQN